MEFCSLFRLTMCDFFSRPHTYADHAESKPIVSFIGDICEPEAIEKAFEGVDCVFHCAAFVNFQFPPDLTELERVNVNGKNETDFPIVIKIKIRKSFFYIHTKHTYIYIDALTF